MSEYKYKCKYCGRESNRANVCGPCHDKLPAVRQLRYICDQIEALRAERDKRRRNR